MMCVHRFHPDKLVDQYYRLLSNTWLDTSAAVIYHYLVDKADKGDGFFARVYELVVDKSCFDPESATYVEDMRFVKRCVARWYRLLELGDEFDELADASYGYRDKPIYDVTDLDPHVVSDYIFEGLLLYDVPGVRFVDADQVGDRVLVSDRGRTDWVSACFPVN